MNRGIRLRLVTLASVLLMTGCTLGDQAAPPLTGPSELSLSLTVAAKPDLLTANGVSQSVISIVARNAYNEAPKPPVDLRIDTINDVGTIVEIGTLSQRQVSTGANGEVSVTFTAPTEVVAGVDANPPVRVRVLPISTNSGTQVPRFVTIKLVPPATIIVPGAPVPSFKFFPTAPHPNDRIVFDASDSKDPDGSIVSYSWEWGDGETVTRSIPTEDHDFSVAGTYYVKLTVTDNSGQQTFITKAVSVQ